MPFVAAVSLDDKGHPRHLKLNLVSGFTYLAAFAYRFNRRFDLRDLVSRLIVDVSRCAPIKESLARQHAEAAF